MPKKIKVLLVDDQAIILDILEKGLKQDPAIEIVGKATDGYLALNMVRRVRPDVILLDMEMPRMNGIQFLHNLMPVNPIPTIVLSALTAKNSKITNDAFEAGAVDFEPKPSGARGLNDMLEQLWTKIKMAATQDVNHLKKKKKSYTLPSSHLDRAAKTDKVILGMGALDVSNNPGQHLKIYALGSCIGLALFCQTGGIVGLAHVVLPQSTTDIEKSKKMPGYFADTAVPELISKMRDLGCNTKIFAKIAGGAKTNVDIGDFFGVGQRNAVSVKASLLKNGVKILSQDVGDTYSRTMTVTAGKAKVELYYPDKGSWMI